MPRLWTDSERNLLGKLYKTTQYKDLEKVFNRSASTINAQARKLGLCKKTWTEEENEILKRLYPVADRHELLTTLRRKWPGIATQAYKLRIKRMGRYSRGPLKVRFENSYIPDPNTGCWLWVGTWNQRGYGTVRRGHHGILAHRLSWELHNGPIPKGLCVCHKCDTPACVNHKHLFLGTQKDNFDDCYNKKRHQHGEKHCRAKLKEADVIAIRHDSRPMTVLAATFHVSPNTISAIRHNRSWKHLSSPNHHPGTQKLASAVARFETFRMDFVSTSFQN